MEGIILLRSTFYLVLFCCVWTSWSSSDLDWCDDDSCAEALDVIREEWLHAQNIHNADKGSKASARMMAFSSSTPEIKNLSLPALAMGAKLKSCSKTSKHGGSACDAFWSGGINIGVGGVGGCGPIDHIRENCPFVLPKYNKINKKYRTINGTCNNKNHRLIGSAGRAYQRFINADYADCIDSPRDVLTGLPSARAVSNAIYQSDMLQDSNILTIMHMTYGQLIDHDTDVTPISKLEDESGTLVDVECGETNCKTDGVARRNCFPIIIPPGDPKFSDEACLKFVRSEEILFDDCRTAPRQQPNDITSWLDASFVYDSYDTAAEFLRTKVDGKLKTIPHPFNPDFLPLIPQKVDDSCRNTDPDAGIECFMAGDRRQNEQAVLTAVHIVFVRYHNYIATNLKIQNPDDNDEELYQESRRIVGAVVQNTIYAEYLPPLLGPEVMKAFHLNTLKNGYFKDYNPNIAEVNPDTSNSFATAAFRFGHSQITTKSRFSDPSLKHQKDVFYSEILFDPNLLYHSGILNDTISGVNAMIIGQTDQAGSQSDGVFTAQIRDSLFTDTPPNGPGMDLPATNTQRGRDHGLPGYTKWRAFCDKQFIRFGLYRYIRNNLFYSFDDLDDFIEDTKIEKLKMVYHNVNDIDLFPAAMLETHVPGGIVGPTFACINALDFHNKKFGDAFYFETKDKKKRFTKYQLNNIRSQTLASIFCKTMEDDTSNPDLTLKFQEFVMLQPKKDAIKALSQSNITNELKNAKLAPYKGRNNRRMKCSEHAQLDFSLFKN